MNAIDQDVRLVELIAELREKETLKYLHELLAIGMSPMKVYDLCYQGMAEVGARYQDGEYALAGLIMAGEIMRRVGQVLLPLLKKKIDQGKAGRIVLGTVAGDIHDLGKDIFKTLINSHGYSVHDLGVDVPATQFLAAIHEYVPDIVGFSCLISSAFESLEETLNFLRKNVPSEVSPRAYIIGGRIDQLVADQVGAEYWTNDAAVGVRLCEKIMSAEPTI